MKKPNPNQAARYRRCRRRAGLRPILLACLSAGLVAALAVAANPTPVVSARALLATDAAYPGSSVRAAVVAEVSPGFHINDHKPTVDYLIPTQLKLETSKDLGAGQIVYPKGQLKKFAFADEALSVYEGTFVVGAEVKVGPSVKAGTYTLNGKLSYQACNDRACFPPTSVPLSLAVKVVPRGTALKRLNADVFNKLQPE